MSAPETRPPAGEEEPPFPPLGPDLPWRPLLSKKSLFSTILEIAIVALPLGFFLAGTLVSLFGRR